MTSFFQELAKKLAERWLTLLMLPGALFVGAAWFGGRAGHRRPWDWSAAIGQLTRLPGATQVLLLVAALLAATATGLAVQGLAGVTRRIWLGQWPRWLGARRVERRRRRWQGRLDVRRELEIVVPRTEETQQRINVAADRINQVAMAKPGRPTWMGDRVHAIEQVAIDRYGLDLPFAWPRLWLLLPDTTRTEVSAAHAAFAAAVATGTWGWPYLVLGVVWWPALLPAIGVGVVGWARARNAIRDLTTLSEAALDLYGRLLAVALGVADETSAGPLTVAEGERISAILRKGR